jgi:septum formation protein
MSGDAARPVLLASASPRRAELLRQMGIPFEVRLPDAPVDETPRAGEVPPDYVERLAREKALAVSRLEPARVTLGADTTVVVDGRILGKPANAADGIAMLLALQNRVHEVCTGVAVAAGGRVQSAAVVTRVRFRAIRRAEAAAYWRTGEGADKAGGYGIQGIGGIFVADIRGSYGAVVGLPLLETEALLREFGVDTWALRRAR